MKPVLRFLLDCARSVLFGGRAYYTFMATLGLVLLAGGIAYAQQLRHGLIVTGLGDEVVWGAYIANFTFLLGLAAASVMVVIPAYVFADPDVKRVVLIAEAMAVCACAMALLFVVVDLGRPDRMLHIVPLLSRVNFPRSLLAWDVVVIPGYLLLNLAIPGYVLFAKYRGREVAHHRLMPIMLVTILWAIALHVVTAFLYVADVARPFWHSALLGPRFLASAFASGPALLLAVLHLLDRLGQLELAAPVRRLLATITAVALQVNLVMLATELFTELYRPTEHALSARYLFLGLGEANALVPWIWSAIAMEVVALGVLMARHLYERTALLLSACMLTVVGVWIEKGMGLVVPGFIPSPLGQVVEYVPTVTETLVCAGIWALGGLLFAVLARPILAITSGTLRSSEQVR